jgi:UDP-N-acetylglucosamine acyltransferase
VTNSIHPSAIVSPAATLGEGNTIGPFVHIHDDVVLGNNNQLMSGAVLKPGVSMEDDNILHEYVVLGGEPQDLGYAGHSSWVKIGSANVFREYVTVHRSHKQDGTTAIGNHNFLMANAHIGHDCILYDNIIIAPSTGIGGHVSIDDRAFISGGVMVHQFVHIGRFAMIGGNSKITQDVLPFMTTDGNPAQVHGLNVVGLRRGGFNKAMLGKLKQAYRILFNNEQRLDARLAELTAMSDPQVNHLVDFISAAKRGFHRAKSESS